MRYALHPRSVCRVASACGAPRCTSEPPSLASPIVAAALAATLVSALPQSAAAQDKPDSRVIVVVPKGNTTDVPMEPDEQIDAVTGITVHGNPVVVIRVKKMPPKPDFNIITPAGISHPFKNGASGIGNMTVEHQPVWVHGVNGQPGHYAVQSVYTQPGGGGAIAVQNFPPGAQLQPDPPQPPGTFFFCPDAVFLTSEELAELFGALGLAADDESEAFWVPSGELYFAHNGWFQPEKMTFDASIVEVPIVDTEAPSPVADLAVEPATPEPQGDIEVNLIAGDDGGELAPDDAAEDGRADGALSDDGVEDSEGSVENALDAAEPVSPCGLGGFGAFPIMLLTLTGLKRTSIWRR